jgi:hypothetical protein
LIGSGGRGVTDRRAVWAELDLVVAGRDPKRVLLRHGACPDGFDQLADEWAAARGIERDPFPADWDSCALGCRPGHRVRKWPGDTVHPGLLDDYCPGAGPRRNAAMVAAGAELLLAMPSARSRGTWNAVRLARAAGIEVRVVKSC